MAKVEGQYFLKDKKAQVYKKVSVPNPGGKPLNKWYPISDDLLWCYAKQLSQDETFYAKTYGDAENRFFVFNHNKLIAFNDYVLYRGTWYMITRVDTTEDYNTDVFVYVKNATGGNIPSQSNVEDYDPDIFND